MKSIIKKFYPFILLVIVVLFSLGKTLEYYFYTDDYAFLYYIGNNLNFGWPYDMVLPLFRPIYALFGTNVLPYFSLALFTYFLASIAVYFFIKELTKNNLIALLSALIFSTGYIGLDQFTMIAVSIDDNVNVINVCLVLILLVKFIETKKLLYYFLTFLMFSFSIRLFPHRAYPLILFVPTLEFVMIFRVDSLIRMRKQLVFFILRYIPFVLIAIFCGIFSYGTNGTEHVNLLNLVTTNNKIFTLLNFEYLKEIFSILGSFIFIKPMSDLFGLVPDQGFFAFTGFIFFVSILLTSFRLFLGKNSHYGRFLLALLLLTIEGYVGNMFLNIDFARNGPVNRYLTISFLSFSAVIPLFLFIFIGNFKRLNRKLTLIIVTILVVISYASLSRAYEDSMIRDRSLPTRNFFKELKVYIPKLLNTDYNIFYFDKASYSPVSTRFENVLRSAAMSNSVNLAILYNISVDNVIIADTFEDFLRLINNGRGRKVSYYTFYYDQNGLYNTTEKTLALLKNGNFVTISGKQTDYKKNGSSVITLQINNVFSLTPLRIKLDLTASPFNSSYFSFPFVGIEDQSNSMLIKEYYEKNNIQKDILFQYLLARKKYYKTVKVDVESIHISKQFTASNLVDDIADSYWLSDQSRWEVHIKPWVKINLGEERNISRLLWRQMPDRISAGFVLSTSSDGNTWTQVSNIRQEKLLSDPNLVVNDFDPVNARFVMLTINSLASSTMPGPGMAEIEVIENKFSNINLDFALRIKENPFEYVKDEKDLLETYEYLLENAKLKIRTMTNKDGSNFNPILQEIPIIIDGKLHSYEFQIPQAGTELKNIQLESNFPLNIFAQNIVLENLSQNDLNKQTKEKCQNIAKENVYANPFICK